MLAEFKDKLINALKIPEGDTYRETMKIATRNQYSWANIAKDWSTNLFV
jgi:hypothetical protein